MRLGLQWLIEGHLLGSEIVEKVIVGQAQWADLFSKHDFFHKYRYYLQVIASTGSAELQMKWYGLLCGYPEYSLTLSH